MNRALTSSLSMDVSIACSSTMRFWLLSAAAPAAASCSAGRAFTNLLGRKIGSSALAAPARRVQRAGLSAAMGGVEAGSQNGRIY